MQFIFKVKNVGNSKPLMLINWIHHNKSESDLFLFSKNLKTERLKPVFEYKRKENVERISGKLEIFK